ncbi:hypothetical protein [Mucilaginibacter sp. FT3.2]|uniref:hypothetical protein n=1 Tax=Mucilaginibacter sp. FT3.2 TaxID=2723090 RepID=UPI0016210FB7|nr:hypothetical protein [Mucilaginibacter sp. FT3.2]MBB6229681.1 hypothetical protein [Mucilaginibacter sp. FT3.2]
MKHFYRLSLAALILPLATIAQSNYKPGYVVTTKGDTLRGSIDLKEWSGNPQDISFKSPSGVKSYTVNDIVFFEVVNAAYRRYNGEISTGETNLQKLSTGVDSAKRKDVVFLKIEQKGSNVTLYSYTDDVKTRFFIGETNQNTIIELQYRIYFVPDRGTVTRNENIYVSQLYNMAQKYNPTSEALKRAIENANYNRADMQSIAQKINNIMVDKTNYGSGAAVKWFVGAGVNASSYVLKGNIPILNGSNKTTFGPMFSAGANIYTNPDVGKLVLRGELMVTTASYNTTVDVYYNQPDQPRGTYSFKQVILSIYPQIIYNFYNTKGFKFYGDVGASINVSKNSGNVLHTDKTNTNSYNYLPLNKSYFSFPIKLGIVLNNRFDVAIAYAYAQSITNNASNGGQDSSNYSIDVSNIRAGISYLF